MQNSCWMEKFWHPSILNWKIIVKNPEDYHMMKTLFIASSDIYCELRRKYQNILFLSIYWVNVQEISDSMVAIVTNHRQKCQNSDIGTSVTPANFVSSRGDVCTHVWIGRFLIYETRKRGRIWPTNSTKNWAIV